MVYFVSGVDTDAGKSIATGWLARRLLKAGKRVITLKLVQTGNMGASEDIVRHRAMMGCTFPEDAEGLTAPEIYPYPCSPHLAAQQVGRPVDVAKILQAVETLAARYEVVLVEGAGGLMVPLSEQLLTIDLAQAQGWPVIFVTGGVLGSINHTLLAYEAMKARGMTVSHVIYNRFPGRKDRLIDDASCRYLQAAAGRLFPSAEWLEMPALTPTELGQPPAPEAIGGPAVQPQRRTFPANLLLEGQLALVVGGGRVGLRKTRTLLEAGARVRLVCPTALPDFAELPVEHLPRPFVSADLMGCKVVVACTDDKHVNRAVLEAARMAGVWCCCADGHWAAGDFIVPASFRTEDVLVSVSTNGRSCRTAKEVKESLSRSLRQCSPGQLFVHGVDRAVALPSTAELSARLRFLNGLYGWAFLSTCNRTELLAWAAPELIASGLLQHALHLPAGAYALAGEAAMHHLTMVLAGMRAQMVGEFHIVGQVRDAIEAARTAGWAHGPLQQAYAEALRRAQHIRTAVAPLIPHIEVEALALEGASGRVVIAGTGALGRAAIARAHQLGLRVTVLYHTHPVPGEECHPLADWRNVVPGANRFITALTVREPLFEAAELPVPAYDLGAPRNIRGEAPHIHTLDDLRSAYLARTGSLPAIEAQAEAAYQESRRG